MQPINKAPAPQWLSGAAIWGLTIASGALNVWGWVETAGGAFMLAAILSAAVVASEVLGVRLALRVEAAVGDWPRFWLAIALLGGVVAFNAFSGHRALEMVEAHRVAPYEAALANRSEAETRLRAVEAQIAGLPAVGADVPAVRIAEIRGLRADDLARLEPQRSQAQAVVDALPALPARPAPVMDQLTLWLIVALIEGLKAFGLFAVNARQKRVAENVVAVDFNPGRELVNKRWANRKTA